MLNLMDKSTEEQIFDNLEERDPDLSEQIRQLMFVFDDLAKVDDRGMQEIIKNVKPEQWMILKHLPRQLMNLSSKYVRAYGYNA